MVKCANPFCNREHLQVSGDVVELLRRLGATEEDIGDLHGEDAGMHPASLSGYTPSEEYDDADEDPDERRRRLTRERVQRHRKGKRVQEP